MSLIVVVFSSLKCATAQETGQQQTDIVQVVQDMFQWVRLAVLLEVVFKLCTLMKNVVLFQRHLQETQVQQRTSRTDTGMLILVMPLSVAPGTVACGWERSARMSPLRSRLRARTLAPPCLVNHYQRSAKG